MVECTYLTTKSVARIFLKKEWNFDFKMWCRALKNHPLDFLGFMGLSRIIPECYCHAHDSGYQITKNPTNFKIKSFENEYSHPETNKFIQPQKKPCQNSAVTEKTRQTQTSDVMITYQKLIRN
jgi:hypothetical protein